MKSRRRSEDGTTRKSISTISGRRWSNVYVKDFSEDDLKQIVAFYESPVGQKTIKNLPGVMREGSMIAQEYTKSKIPSLNAQLTPILVKYRDQMDAGQAGGAGGGAPGAGAAPGTAPAPSGN